MEKQSKITHKEAVRMALEELGGRARLRDIYPRVIPIIKYKPGSNIQATLRRQLQTTPKLFRRVKGMRGWYELVTYEKVLANRDKKFSKIATSQITEGVIIMAFDDLDTLVERLYAKHWMQIMFSGNEAWENAYKKMKRDGYFKEISPQLTINNPQFGSLYEVKDNDVVNIQK